MTTIAVAFFLSLAAALLGTPLVRGLAVRSGAIDHALSSRKIHGRPVPRLGGVAIVGAFFVPLMGLLWMDTAVGRLFWENGREAWALIAGGLAIAALGVYDDLRGSSATKKLAVQFAVAGLMWWAGYRIERISTPFGGAIELGILGLPVTLLWIAGVTNAMNLIDGLDGLAGGVALAAVAATFTISLDAGQLLLALMMASLGGALLGFLRYNFHPASIFMGDTGSMFLGFVLAAASLRANQKAPAAVALIAPIVMLGLPIGDTLLSMARRAIRGQRMFASDRRHIHHRLLDLGLSQRATALVLYALCVVLASVAVALTRATAAQTVAYLAGLAVLAGVLLVATGYARVSEARKVPLDRKRNLAMRAAVRRAAESLRTTASAEEIWAVVKDVAPWLEASCIALRVVRRNGHVEVLDFSDCPEGARPAALRARFSLLGERPGDGAIELGWDDGRSTVDRDTEIFVEQLCGHVHAAVERLDAPRRGDAGVLAKVVSLRR